MLLVLIVWLATAAVPVLHTTFLFSEAIRHEVNYGPINEPAEAIRGRILTRATRLGLEVEPGDVVVERSGGKLVITAHYGVPVELAPGVAWTIELSHNQQGMRRSAVFGNS